MKDIMGGITAPKGFQAGVAQCEIKYRGRPDLALVVSDEPAAAAGMFTTNRIQGAPVKLSREYIKRATARAIIANSGNANVCTGGDGDIAARTMTREAAKLIGCMPEEVLVASTGVIGRPFPLEKVLNGIPAAFESLSTDAGNDAARAIITTDTVEKETSVEFELDGTAVRIGAVAKGSGMISPNMATMFCFLTTDADIRPGALQRALETAVRKSFNCITVDGDMSTSDTVFVLANGMAGNETIGSFSKALEQFTDALTVVCLRMAKAIVRDGEGATRFITINVTGAAEEADARRVGLSIANSPLVKTAMFGNDPNWGRIICAAGYSGVDIDEQAVTIMLDGVTLFDRGEVLPLDEKALRESMSAGEITVDVDLGAGKREAVIYTSDLSYEYVKINAEYTT